VRYRLADPDVMVACGVMRAVLERRLTRLGRIAAGGTRFDGTEGADEHALTRADAPPDTATAAPPASALTR
jgi:hypothetical protein